MFDIQLATISGSALVMLREGFESILLTGLMVSSLPNVRKSYIYVNFIATWIITMLIGWLAIDWLWPRMEDIEHWLLLASGTVLVYIFINSRAIFEHAKQHVSYLGNGRSGTLVVHLTVFAIVLREALESTVFLGSNMFSDPMSVFIGLIVGTIALIILLLSMDRFGKKLINGVMFRYVGYLLLAFGIYYIFEGLNGLLFEHTML